MQSLSYKVNEKFMKAKSWVWVGMMCCWNICYAQIDNTKIIGTVIDSISKQPLNFATVSLLKDNKLWRTETTDLNGVFTFKKIEPNNYEVIINYLGYNQKVVNITISAKDVIFVLPKVSLVLNNIDLKEVTVKATKPFIEQAMDRVILNIEGSIMANSGSTLDVLKRSPSVQVNENDGTMTLRGTKVMVYIDGKLSQLTAESLEGFLSSMPSNSIDKIELISNPSAKYEAAGMAIINIRTLKMKNFGVNGTWNSGMNIGRYLSGNSGLLLNYKKNKLTFIGNYNYTLSQNYVLLQNYRTILDKQQYFEDNEFYKRKRQIQFYKTIVDYDLSKKTSIGVLFQGGNNNRHAFMNAQTSIGKSSFLIDSLITVDSDNTVNLSNWNANFNFKHKFKTNQIFTFDIDYASYGAVWDDTFKQSFFNKPLNTEYKPTNEIWLPWGQKTLVKSIKSDYTYPTKLGNLEIGVQARNTQMNMTFDYQEKKDNIWVKNTQKSFLYDYTENVNAAYININGKKGTINYQLGVRSEQSNILVANLDVEREQTQKYLNLFPSLALQYDISKKQRISFSYTSRISRPSYYDLNERPVYFNPYRQTLGNAYLKPTIINSIETRWSFDQTWLLTVGYQKNNNDIGLIPTVVDNITKYKSYNFNFSKVYSLDVVYNKNIKTWWNTNTGFQYFYTNNNFENLAELNNTQISSFYFRSNNYFTLKNGIKLELTGYYYPAQTFGAFKNMPLKKIDFSVQKTVLNKKGDLRLNITDVFNLYTLRYLYKTIGVNGDENIKSETRFLKLTFLYRFGNSNVKPQDRKLGIEKESNRIDK